MSTLALASAACLDLGEAASGLFDAAVRVAVTDPRDDHDAPFPEETAAVARAVPKRQREFRAGRAAVRQAMGQMGLPAAAIPVGPLRAPLWPGKLTGSISHSATACIAAVAQTSAVPALGVDIEDLAPLDTALIPDICTLLERAWLASRPEGTRGQLAKLIFSAKEAAYKCQFGISRTLLDFHDLEITVDPETGQLDATFARAVPGFDPGSRLYGRYDMAQGHIVTAITAAGIQTGPKPERRLSFW